MSFRHAIKRGETYLSGQMGFLPSSRHAMTWGSAPEAQTYMDANPELCADAVLCRLDVPEGEPAYRGGIVETDYDPFGYNRYV